MITIFFKITVTGRILEYNKFNFDALKIRS
jgi:hypothetical protein